MSQGGSSAPLSCPGDGKGLVAATNSVAQAWLEPTSCIPSLPPSLDWHAHRSSTPTTQFLPPRTTLVPAAELGDTRVAQRGLGPGPLGRCYWQLWHESCWDDTSLASPTPLRIAPLFLLVVTCTACSSVPRFSSPPTTGACKRKGARRIQQEWCGRSRRLRKRAGI